MVEPSAWIHHLPPGSILVLGALLLPVLRGGALRLALLALPLASGWHLASFDVGTLVSMPIGELMLTPVRVDRLSLVWGVWRNGQDLDPDWGSRT